MLHSSSSYVPDTKVCTVCGKDKPIGQFYTDHKASDNHNSECKTCTKKYTSNVYFKKKKERDFWKEYMPI